MKWTDIKNLAQDVASALSPEYRDRLALDIKEIEKQGAESYWENIVSSRKKFDTNKNGLVLPFLIKVTSVDPIKEGIKPRIEYQPDFPDIDIDFLPIVRDQIKEHAGKLYGEDKVCSVGTWQTYKPKLAIQDAARALGIATDESRVLTKNLPDEFDELSKDEALEEFNEFKDFYEKFRDVVDLAYRMRDRIKTQGKHAGGLIISSVPVRDFIPLAMPSPADREFGRWSSTWTEGRNLQLSKFGFVKFDFLGVRTLAWCWDAAKRIFKNRGVRIDWSDMSPEETRAGYLIDEQGNKVEIRFDDEQSLAMANAGKMETIFQFETDLATSIVHKGGVKSFNDLVIYTSLGRPGPLPMVDNYIARRDGLEDWISGQDERIIDILRDTYGIIVFQEDLAKMWLSLAGFTKPEAEAARKAVAKKWEDKLKPIEAKWMEGATRTIGKQLAKEWWERMTTFGRYAFNKSHATAYGVITFRCLWLKAHFLPEWWAAVLSDVPHRDKLIRWMGVARREGVKFGTLNVNNLTPDFSVKGDEILPGLSMIKGIGESITVNMKFIENGYKNIQDFISRHGSSKTLLERLIKLGAFDSLHPNRKALWVWWQYMYGSDDEAKTIKRQVNWSLTPNISDINKIRSSKAEDYLSQNSKRKVIPKAILNWVPTEPAKNVTLKDPPEVNSPEHKISSKIKATLQDIEKLYTKSFSLLEIARFEKAYLGFHWQSPMKLFKTRGRTISKAKANTSVKDDKWAIIEVIIEEVEFKTKDDKEYAIVNLTDWEDTARIMIWHKALEFNKDKLIVGLGVKLKVAWNDEFRSFNLERGSQIATLERADDVTTD